MNARALYPEPALLIEAQEPSLVVSDLHLGFEHELAEKGVTFRSPSLGEIVERLVTLVEAHSAKSLIILGDLKHSIGASITKSEWDEVPSFLRRLGAKVQIYLVPGNHDANIRHLVPDSVNLMASSGMVMHDTLFLHGHTTLPAMSAKISGIVMGHSHPVYLRRSSVLNGKQVWVYMKVARNALFAGSEGVSENEIDVIVLPSFNRYLYATGVRAQSKRGLSPVLSKILENRDLMTRCVITTLDGAVVGDESSLQYVLPT